MSKKVKITEEQYNTLVNEGITIDADVNAANGDVKKAVDTANQEAAKQGLRNYNISVPGKNNENCSRVITKKEIYENRLNTLKQNSTVFTIKDFIKK